MSDTISCQELKPNLSKYYIIDVREDDEYSVSHIQDAMNIPLGKLIRDEKLGIIEKDKEIVVHCQSGLRGEIARKFLKEHGYKVKNLEGGYKEYEKLHK